MVDRHTHTLSLECLQTASRVTLCPLAIVSLRTATSTHQRPAPFHCPFFHSSRLRVSTRLHASTTRMVMSVQILRLVLVLSPLVVVALLIAGPATASRLPSAVSVVAPSPSDIDSVPVYRPTADLHGRLPSSCAIDEGAGELIVSDDYTRIAVLSLSNGSTELRSVPGVMRPDTGLYAIIQAVAVQPRRGDSSLLWLSLEEDSRDTPDPRASLLVVDSSDLSTIVHVIGWKDTDPPLGAETFSSLHASLDGELMHGLVVPSEEWTAWWYVFNSTTGMQNQSQYATSGDAQQVSVFRNATTHDEQLLFVPAGDHEQLDSVYVTKLDGLPWRTVSLLGLPPVSSAPLVDVMAVDNQQRLWLMDQTGMLYAFCLNSGRLLSNVTWSLPDDVEGDFHTAAWTADGQRAYVLGYVSAYTSVIDTASGKQVAAWQSERHLMYVPTMATFDESSAVLPERHIIVTDVLSWVSNQLSRVSLSGEPLGAIPVSLADMADLGPTGAYVVDAPAEGELGDIWLLTVWDPLNSTMLHSVVHHLTGNGTSMASFSIPLAAEFARGSNHTWWVSDLADTAVQRRSDEGRLLSSLPLAADVWGVGALPALADHYSDFADDTVVVSLQDRQCLVELSLNGTELRSFGSTVGSNELPYTLAVDALRRLVYSVQCVAVPELLLPDRCFVRVFQQQRLPNTTVAWEAVAELRPMEAYLPHSWFLHPTLSKDGTQLLVPDAEYNKLLLWNLTQMHAQLSVNRQAATAAAWHQRQKRKRMHERNDTKAFDSIATR